MNAMTTPRVRLSSEALAEDHDTNAESEAKRKKIRRGTRSCWECKRRKMKCIFHSATDDICAGCQRRAIKCVSQDSPEEAPAPLNRFRQMSDRVMKVEGLIEQLIKQVGNAEGMPGQNGDKSHPDITTSTSIIDSESSRVLTTYKSSKDSGVGEDKVLDGCLEFQKLEAARISSGGAGKYERLSRILHASLPSREDTERIEKSRSQVSKLFDEMSTIPCTALDKNDIKLPESLVEMPGPTLHPVLIARHMLQLAITLQQPNSDLDEGMVGLSEPPCMMMQRLANIAISLVTTKDELLGSIEGLECIMMEVQYHATGGNLRRAWAAVRKAMVIAQLMGLHRPCSQARYKVLDSKTKVYPQFIWFRMVSCDRHICFMLGLPQATLDRNMASEEMLANDTPIGRLERIHCVLASCILERNESDPNAHDFARTQELDMELQKAAKSLPSRWWLIPTIANLSDDPKALFWDIRRLTNQIYHYSLLNQLHLPHMLRSTVDKKHEYSKIICVNASREMLSRFIVFRSFRQASLCYRARDFFALIAAITLLLAHLDSHHSLQVDNLLAHQCLSDRGLIEQAQKSMEEVSRLKPDPLSAKSADLLRRLLIIEAEAADGNTHSTQSVSVQSPPETETTQLDEDNCITVSVYIPYFGTIKIARKDAISKEEPKPQSSATRSSQTQPSIFPCSEVTVRSSVFAGSSETSNSGVIASGYKDIETFSTMRQISDAHTQAGQLQAPLTEYNSVTTQFAPQSPSAASGILMQQYSGLAVGVDDWALHGADLSFFDNLMKGIGDDRNDGADWAA